MKFSLRWHVSKADEIMSCLGVRTLIPQKGVSPPKRKNVRAPKLDERDYALSILIPMERCDQSGYLAIYLRASREASCSIWERIPERMQGKVGWEIRRLKRALREGGIGVE